MQSHEEAYLDESGRMPICHTSCRLSPEALDTLLVSRVPLLTADERSNWTTQVQEGHDDTLKALLAFSLPRLQTLVFTAYSVWDAPTLTKINEYIRKLSLDRLKGLNIPAWYSSIETVRLNHWVENRHPHDQLNITVRQAGIFLSLPNNKKFYTGIGGYRDDHDYQWEFEPRSSPVEFLDGAAGILETLFASSLEFLQAGSFGKNHLLNLRRFEKLRLPKST